MLKPGWCVLVCLTVLVAPTGQAHAISKKLSAPYTLKEKQWKIEDYGDVGFEYGQDNAVWSNTTELKYGVLPWLELSGSAEFEKQQGDNIDYRSTEFGVKFPLAPRDSMFLNLAGKISYNHADNSGAADRIKGQVLFGREDGKWETRGKITMEEQVGEDREHAFRMGLGLGAYHKCMENLTLGVEYFADPGAFDNDRDYSAQEHQIGPVVGFKVPETPISMKLGYLVGISRAADDGAVKYELDVKF